MCQYSADEGSPTSWHLVHLGSRAVGGAGLVIVEATGVTAQGRISPGDAGLWNEKQMHAWSKIAEFVRAQGAVAGIQLAHAGRKASTNEPWNGDGALPSDKAWATLAPSAVAFKEDWIVPQEMTKSDMQKTIADFLNSAKLAERAGFQVIEIHMAHGYLLHEFLSPLANFRKDEYGGSLENRMRFPLEVATALRKAWTGPLFVRISATDWDKAGWDTEQSIALAKELKKIGIDLIDCSTGGILPSIRIPTGPGYQVPYAESVRKGADILTGAVGMITEAKQAEAILAEGKADVVLLARALLNDPYWPLHAAHELGEDIEWPKQYGRAKKSVGS